MSAASPAPHSASHPHQPEPASDPVRDRRRRIARWTRLANRVGYLLFLLAIVMFVLAFSFGFNSTMSALIVAAMIAGSVLLAPAIVLGYAVKAAERDDRERGL
jgi:hypothetical protein